MGEQCGLNLISFTTGMAWLGEFGLAIWVRNHHFQNHHTHRHHRQFYQYYQNHQRDNVAHGADHLGYIGFVVISLSDNDIVIMNFFKPSSPS